ncbi:hypothetical protein TNCV_3407811 [Trichonephila clavipes]|nr:hypothetical protein TNCV_3407811 [Trichonephila clavipes]
MLPMVGKKAVLEWCMKEGLIGLSYVCPKCGKNMELRERTEERSGRGFDPGLGVLFQKGGFSGRRKREKATRNGVYVLFKADRTTSKRIRFGFITVKSTTLIGLNCPRKNTTLPAIRSVEPGRTHIPVQSLFPVNRANAKIKNVSQGPAASHHSSPLSD